jgi:hypothetical protein
LYNISTGRLKTLLIFCNFLHWFCKFLKPIFKITKNIIAQLKNQKGRLNQRWRRKYYFIFHIISSHFDILAWQQCFYFYIALELPHIKKWVDEMKRLFYTTISSELSEKRPFSNPTFFDLSENWYSESF